MEGKTITLQFGADDSVILKLFCKKSYNFLIL